ncbi:hypothetical protein VMCG_08859 [Cytospora schulzeri]|uniref:Uncharacterized protein n=1 Tax=Cytospora schulzeri TaxID=448051 RepID=A0A423VUK3_9PEZI|nr:hypothetical protein VMCG_08859 [Valsa malicola]
MDNDNIQPDDVPLSGSEKHKRVPELNLDPKRIAFMGGNDDFRAARTRCALACAEYNKLKEDAPVEDRVKAWLRIVDPDNDNNSAKSNSAVDFSALFKGGLDTPTAATATTDDAATATNKDTPPVSPTTTGAPVVSPCPTIPYIKTPIYIDYGLRVRIAPTTFINRNCTILDTPVADVVIGEKCSIGTGVTIISVGHPVNFDDRCEFKSGKPGSWGAKVVIGDGVWIGAGVTILPGITIGSYSTIGAGSLVDKDVPPRCVAKGNPATVRYSMDDDKGSKNIMDTARTLEAALKMGRGLDGS